jgi:DDE superfamily endonuclease
MSNAPVHDVQENNAMPGSGGGRLLRLASIHIDGIQYCIYGGSAYVLHEYLMVGFDGTGITPEQAAFNKAMSRSRVTVEWIFKDIKRMPESRCLPAKACVVQDSCWSFARNQHYSLELPLLLVRIAYLTLLLVPTSNS